MQLCKAFDRPRILSIYREACRFRKNCIESHGRRRRGCEDTCLGSRGSRRLPPPVTLLSPIVRLGLGTLNFISEFLHSCTHIVARAPWRCLATLHSIYHSLATRYSLLTPHLLFLQLGLRLHAIHLHLGRGVPDPSGLRERGRRLLQSSGHRPQSHIFRDQEGISQIKVSTLSLVRSQSRRDQPSTSCYISHRLLVAVSSSTPTKTLLPKLPRNSRR